MKIADIVGKIKLGNNNIIIIVFIIAIMYFVILFITSIFNNKTIETTNQIDTSNIESYVKKENTYFNLEETNIVKDFSTFYALESSIENYLGYLNKEEYSKTYNILTKEYKKEISKSDYVERIKNFSENRIIIRIDETKANFSKNLNEAYGISENSYLCYAKDVKGNVFEIGIKLSKKDKKYEVFYIEM